MTEIGPRIPTSGDGKHQSAARLIGTYHREQLRALLGHLRTAFDRLDGGTIDEFDLDEMIRHYERSTAKLRNFCGSSGAEREEAARNLEALRASGEEPNWWDVGAQR